MRECVCTGEGDRPNKDKEHFRAVARARGESKVRVSVAAGKEKRRRTRGRVTPECPRFLLSVPSLLSLVLSVPLVLTRVPQSSSLAGPSISFSFLLLPDSPTPGYIISLFFSTSSVFPSYKWRAPSLVVSCPTVSCACNECSFRLEQRRTSRKSLAVVSLKNKSRGKYRSTQEKCLFPERGLLINIEINNSYRKVFLYIQISPYFFIYTNNSIVFE